MLFIFFASFLSSTIVTMLIIYIFRRLGHIGMDEVNGGPQKFHSHPVPRVGGIGIMAGLLGAAAYMAVSNTSLITDYSLLLLSAIPAFGGGLTEDLTKKAGVKARLILTLLSAGMGAYLLNALINRVDIPVVDSFLSSSSYWSLIGAYCFTMVAVGGIANAINIIDGFNGIAGMVSLIIISALGYVSYVVGDNSLMSICVAIGGAIVGFLMWNYPAGMIFLGDGGAYLLGFLIGEVSVIR